MNRRVATWLFISLWLVFLVHFNPGGTDTNRFARLTMSITERQQIDVDTEAAGSAGFVVLAGRRITRGSPGIAFLAAPAWSLAYWFYSQLPPKSPLCRESVHVALAHFISTAVTSALAGALTALLLALFVYDRTLSYVRAIGTALLYAFGSIAFYYSTQMNDHVVVAALLFGAFTLVFAPEALRIGNERMRLALIGLCAGLTIFVDVSSVPMVVALSVYAIRSLKDRSVVSSGITAAILPLLALLCYCSAAFHSQNPATSVDRVQQASILGVAWPNASQIGQVLGSSFTGIFFMPFTLVSCWILVQKNRQTYLLTRQERQAIVVACLLSSVCACATPNIEPQFGPGFLLPSIPFLCLVFGMYANVAPSAAGSHDDGAIQYRGANGTYFERRPGIPLALASLSLLVNVAGAQV
ncbi:MAG: hypothetical protein ACLQVD_15865, partial [Capsulimonadaceae bacterium]